jgi:predicted phosphodiesterase
MIENVTDHKKEPLDNSDWMNSLFLDIDLVISKLKICGLTEEEKSQIRKTITDNCGKIINSRFDGKYLKPIESQSDFGYISMYQNKLYNPLKTRRERSMIYLLHISDLHLGRKEQANKYRVDLKIDLQKELEIARLDYIVISGDIAQKSKETEYDAALELINGMKEDFGLDSSKVIIVPGNHDVNYDLSEQSYNFIYNTKRPSILKEGQFIAVEPHGILLRNDEAYIKRFNYFNEFFYKRFYMEPYPSLPSEQGILHAFPDDKIIFLAINSSWEIDHHFESRASINDEALSDAVEILSKEDYKNWLKIAVWHHPVTGEKQMNSEFLERLSVCGVKICMHGHLHEAIEGFYKYDDNRGINLIGAGTFGAKLKEQSGIPLQYNLLKVNLENRTIIVETRKKEKEDGAWCADSRWGSKKNPSPRYQIDLI